MTPAESERLRSWAISIGEAIVGKGRDEGAEVKFSGGLLIRRSDGAWFSFTAGKGGFDVVELIEIAGQYTRPDALKWAQGWLASHPGFGGCAATDDDYHPASKGAAERILAEA